ncbi:putative thioredoxin [Wallemia mellicola CBS 633.66]|uniref:Putative thioredoxin n=1 Tax=Wallemia mellicola (strain ATCC MYA-4683 / CBS 633.66) TaxID=671144 RepID=I4YJ01_WALMC|nr:putative thioredoxin [Wallemia mellicola CBS 633.66]EIM23943.1 putative thioredoxin [Wallemia mellicola CBS 633.66]|eukprot:XP_006955782.1 putative thioredoxin [Wallemia mellicola CBS 633.66]
MLKEVQSPEEFQDILSNNLNSLSVLNFWAPWAEPCQQMNQVTKELAEKYTNVVFLQIEAESLPDISETFDIEAVPSFILLRGHTLLERISGANAALLAQSVSKHALNSAQKSAQSSTILPPQAPAAVETEEELNSRCLNIMKQSDVVLFMKGDPDAPRCGFSKQTVALLREQSIEFSHFDILQDESVRQHLKKLNDWPTFPQIIVKGELIGGLDILREMIEQGELQQLME